MWREYNITVIDNFRTAFKNLEDIGILNKHDNVGIWSLHHVHSDMMQKELNGFKEYHNNHPIRTAGGKTSNQIHTISDLQDQLISSIFLMNHNLFSKIGKIFQ